MTPSSASNSAPAAFQAGQVVSKLSAPTSRWESDLTSVATLQVEYSDPSPRGESAPAKVPGCVSIDMDTLSDYARGYGFSYDRRPDPVYEVGLPRFLDALAERNIRATLFVIGRDAAVPAHAEVLRRAVEQGHELANHTMTHPRRLAALPDSEVRREVLLAHDVVSELRGSAVRGFRAPCYDISGAVIDVLMGLKYLYDSSVHPIALGPVIDLAVLIKSRFGIREWRPGTYVHVFAPPAPYRLNPSRPWRPAARGPLVELPLSAVPWTRMPFYGTFVQATGMKRFHRDLRRLSRTNRPLNFHFHAVELVGLDDPGVDGRLAVHPGLARPVAEKRADVHDMLDSFTSHYEMMTLEDLATRHLRTPG